MPIKRFLSTHKHDSFFGSSQNKFNSENERKKFHFPDALSYLRVGPRELFLIGTNHSEPRCVSDVRRLIDLVQPDYVFVEACERQAEAHRWRIEELKQFHKRADEMRNITYSYHSIFNFPSIISSALKDLWFLLRFRYSGGEFSTAISEADNRGIPLIYGDISEQEKKETIKKAFLKELKSGNPFQGYWNLTKTRTRGAPTSGNKGSFSRESTREQNASFKKLHPHLWEAIVKKRDEKMCICLLQKVENGKVVVVIGAGHLDGMEKILSEES